VFEEKQRLEIHKKVHDRKSKIGEYGSPERCGKPNYQTLIFGYQSTKGPDSQETYISLTGRFLRNVFELMNSNDNKN
jgi:hypothetical protein